MTDISDTRFRAALETMPDIVMMTTAVRGSDGQIVDFVVDYVNPAIEIGQHRAREGTEVQGVLTDLPDDHEHEDGVDHVHGGVIHAVSVRRGARSRRRLTGGSPG